MPSAIDCRCALQGANVADGSLARFLILPSDEAAHVYGGLLATLTAWCEEQSIPYQSVAVGTIKRFATGKGNADKQAMIAAIRERGFDPADDNEADAIAILLWALETNGGLA